MAVKIDFTPIQEETIQFTPFEEVEEVVEERGPTDIERLKDIAKQIPVSAIKGVGGAYGNLLQALGIQDKELLPGEKIRAQEEFDVLEKLQEPGYKPTLAEIMSLTDDSIIGGLRGLPTSEDIGKGFEAVGIEPEAATPAGRIAGKGVESLTETAAFAPGSPAFMLASLLGGAGGQAIRELGGPEGLATGVDIATSLTPAAKGAVKGIKALKKIPEMTKAGITKLRGVGKEIKRIKPVTQKKFIQASRVLQKDIGRQIKKMTDEKLPFSKLVKGDNEIWNRFEKAFNIVDKEAASIEKTAEGGRRIMFKPIEKSIREAKKVASPSDSTKAYVKQLRTFQKDLGGRDLSASEWQKQYREINKGIRDLSTPLTITEGRAGKLEALHELRRLTADSIEANFKDHPEFVQSFKSLNKAYSNFKNYESVNQLLSPSYTAKGINPKKFVATIGSKKGKHVLTNALGKEGYREVLDISKDMEDVSKLFEMFNVQKSNWTKLKTIMGPYMLRHMIALVSTGLSKAVYPFVYGTKGLASVRRGINNTLLSPAGRRDWKAAVDAIKKQDKKQFTAAAAKLKDIFKKDPEDIEEE